MNAQNHRVAASPVSNVEKHTPATPVDFVVMPYFVNTGDGIEFCDTREKAMQIAQKAIDDWRDCCDPEWPEEVENVCWGEVLGESKAIDIEDGDYVNYELAESPAEWRCNICGGLVSFDGTKPGISA